MVKLGSTLENLLNFLLTLILVVNSSFSLGHLLSVIAYDINLAVCLAAPISALQMLFCEMFLNKS
jgi:hypothetical protein